MGEVRILIDPNARYEWDMIDNISEIMEWLGVDNFAYDGDYGQGYWCSFVLESPEISGHLLRRILGLELQRTDSGKVYQFSRLKTDIIAANGLREAFKLKVELLFNV